MKFYSLRKNITLLEKPVWQILAYLIIAISISICFFYLQHYFLLLYRRLQLSLAYNTEYFLSKETILYLSVAFAGNAILLGNSVLLVFLSLKSRSFTKENFRRGKIRNNQAFLIGCYYFFAFKILFVTYASSDYLVIWDFGLAQYFIYLYPLLFFTLFLESIKDLRRYSKGYTLKKTGVHLLLLVIFSFILGQLGQDDYEITHNQLAKSNPYAAIPKVEDYDTQNLLTFHSDICDTRFKVLNDNGEIFIDRFSSKFPINEVGQLMIESCSHYHDAERSSPLAFVSSDIKMKVILELELNLSLYNTNRITYAFDDKHTFDNYYTIDGVVKPIIIPESYYNKHKSEIPPPHFPYDELERSLSNTEIIQVDIGCFQTSHSKMDDKVKFFKDKIKRNTVFNFVFNEDELFNNYLLTAISLQIAAKQLRQEAETLSELPDNYFDLSASEKEQYDGSYENDQLELKLLFPMRSIDNYVLDRIN